MDFAFFESLSASEARSLLDGFLETERGAVEQTLRSAREQGVETDYSIESLAPLMRWAIGQLKTVPLPEDPTVPIWIRETDSYKRNLLDFDEPSKPVVLRMAYYMGQCFVRNFLGLTWTIGNARTAQKNMPVVAGFRSGIEMAPMLIAENLFLRVLSGAAKEDAIDIAVRHWTGMLQPQ